MASESNTFEATVCIRGMHCASCELLLERELKKIPGMVAVDVDHRKGTAKLSAREDRLPDPDRIAAAIHEAGYSLTDEEMPTVSSVAPDRKKWMEIGGLLLIIFAIYQLIKGTDLASLAPSTTGALSVGGIFLIGLIAGTSSCLAVTGGLLLAMAAKYNETFQSSSTWEKFRPLLQFNLGRLASYFVLGGFVGLLGKSITLSPSMTAYLNIGVALIMLYLALTILQILPRGSLPIRPPKKLSRWIAGLAENRHPAAPFALGALTFFLPCGFTQSLQLVALASGDFLTGALTMGVFALGTLPSLLGISAISSKARGSASRLFLRFSGTLVLILALFNLNSGLTLAGIDLTGNLGASVTAGSAPPVVNGVQEVTMKVTSYGYEPDTITIKAGVPVRWIVDGTEAYGCTSSLVIPSLNVSRVLQSGANVIEFTAPQKPGRLPFSCAMGMVRGSFTVI